MILKAGPYRESTAVIVCLRHAVLVHVAAWVTSFAHRVGMIHLRNGPAPDSDQGRIDARAAWLYDGLLRDVTVTGCIGLIFFEH
jgi:hypothetical protein